MCDRGGRASCVPTNAAFRASNTARLAWEPGANEVFAILSNKTIHAAKAAGAAFYEWHTPAALVGQVSRDEQLCRFVTSFATTEEEVTRLAELIRQ